MRILILGGNGFLGKAIAVQLARQGGQQIFSRSRTTGVDLTHYDSTRYCLESVVPDTIINCAAHVGGLHYVSAVPADVFHDNMLMALNLYRAVKDVCPNAYLVNPLSNCAYPGDDSNFFEQCWLDGDVHRSVYPYGHAKRAHYVASVCYAKQYAVQTLNLLIPNAFGPGDRDDANKVHAINGMIIRMLRAHHAGEDCFEIWGTGRPVREWIYVEDAARLVALAAATRLVSGEPINIAQNKGYSIVESAVMIAKAVGFTGDIRFQPKMQDGAFQKVMNDELFRKYFPTFEFLDHQLGIYKTVEYYRDRLFAESHAQRRYNA